VQAGGSDLVFPHHEMSGSHARVACASAEDDHVFARVYAHSGMVAYQGAKMSKSLGNLVFVSRLRAAGVDPMAIRLALIGRPNVGKSSLLNRFAGSERVIVYFHGSALVTLGLNSHRRFVSKLSAATGAQVFNVGYRLAPQVSIEEAVSDGVDAYRYVLSHGFAPDRIVLAGDSAGGLMAADTAIAARDAGLPVPAGQALLSPLTSADMSLKYRALKEHHDALFPFMTVKFIYDVFATVNGTRPPPVMPPEADLHGLGPFLLQVGTHEMLLNDTFALAERLRADNVPVWVQVWHKAMHMFQLSFDVNPDARRAVDEVAAFIHHVTTARDEASA